MKSEAIIPAENDHHVDGFLEISEPVDVKRSADIGKQVVDKVDTVYKGSPFRLRTFLKLWKNIAIKGKIAIDGEKNLDRIPSGARVIFASSHVSDGDMPLAASVFCDKYDLAIADQSTHHNWMQEPAMKAALLAVGEQNFLPIDFTFRKEATGSRKVGLFNPQNYLNMKNALEEKHKSVLIAAHSPSYGNMPENGGVGVIYLAQITGDSVVVPVASMLDTSADRAFDMTTALRKFATRPSANVVIGEHIQFEKIPGIENLADLIAKEDPTKSDLVEIDRMKRELRKQSDILMKEIAKLMPESKRGKW